MSRRKRGKCIGCAIFIFPTFLLRFSISSFIYIYILHTYIYLEGHKDPERLGIRWRLPTLAGVTHPRRNRTATALPATAIPTTHSAPARAQISNSGSGIALCHSHCPTENTGIRRKRSENRVVFNRLWIDSERCSKYRRRSRFCFSRR